VTALLKMGQALLSDHKRASRIYTVHQIKALHRRVRSSRQRYCRGVIDQNIDSPKMRNGMRNSRLHRGLIADVNSNGQRTTASRFHFLCSGVYSARDPETKCDAAGGAAEAVEHLGSSVSDLAAITMLAPSFAARRAIASPIPRDAPVMNKVKPRKERCCMGG
jgi:hypothetical protein